MKGGKILLHHEMFKVNKLRTPKTSINGLFVLELGASSMVSKSSSVEIRHKYKDSGMKSIFPLIGKKSRRDIERRIMKMKNRTILNVLIKIGQVVEFTSSLNDINFLSI